MAQDTTAKKSNFLSNVVANAVALKAARDQAKALAEELASDATISGIVDADCTGANSHLTRALVNNYLQGTGSVQGGLEAMITNQAVVQNNRLPALMAVIPA